MSALDALATQVLLGSARRAPQLPQDWGALNALLEQANSPDTALETQVLRWAGALALCTEAGFVAPSVESPAAPAAPPPTRPTAEDPAALSLLTRIFNEGPDALRREGLLRLEACQCDLPPGLLPLCLSLAQKSRALRPALLPVLGARGRWLAGLNPAWAYALGGAEAALDVTHWEEGSLEQRKVYLDALRRRNPEAARTLLQEGFAQCDARERSSLLDGLAVGLSAGDEAFLLTALADRSKEVRQTAAKLLACLPEGAWVARMAARMQACLKSERKLLRRVWVLEAPERFEADWKADAIEETRAKNESLGDRAWWLYQIARLLPLAWWPAATGMSPPELLNWVQKGDWSEAVLRAWSEAFSRQPDPEWAEALLAQMPLKGCPLDVHEVLGCLAPQAREAVWLGLLESGGRQGRRGDVLGRIVLDQTVGGTTLSADFSRRVLATLRAALPTDSCKWDYALRTTLPEFACFIPPECLAEAALAWPAGRPDTDYFNEALARMLAILELRQILHRIL